MFRRATLIALALAALPLQARAAPPRVLALVKGELKLYKPQGKQLVELGAQDLRPYLGDKDYGEHTALLTTPDAVIVVAQGALVMFDRAFRNPRVWRPKEGRGIAAAATYEQQLLVAVNGELQVLDRELKAVGKVKLPTGLPFPKDAHDILVHQQRAYLLDNIVIPRWIFVVDLTQVSAPKVAGTLKVSGVYQHLSAQWIAPKVGRWVVAQNSGGRGGASQTLLFMPLDPPLRVLKEQTTLLHSIKFSSRLAASKRRGYSSRSGRLPPTPPPPRPRADLRILSVSPGPGGLAVIQRGGATKLARLRTTKTRVSARGLVRLDEEALRLLSPRMQRSVASSRQPWRLCRSGEHVAVSGMAAVFLVRLKRGKARIVASFSTLAGFKTGSYSLAPFLGLQLL